jgi:hypothetical protein
MRWIEVRTLATAILLGLVSPALAQDPRPPRDGEAPKPGERPERFGPPPFVLQDALDTNKDGKLSAEEIKAAAEPLKRLDKNKDGKLSAEELGWPPQMPGFGRGGGRFPGGPPFGGERGGRSFVQRLMSRDANGDGQVTKDELPKSMQFLIRLGDQNQDGAINEQEAQQLARQLGLAAERRDSSQDAPGPKVPAKDASAPKKPSPE